MSDSAIKPIHRLAAAITAMLFMLRGYWMAVDSSLPTQRWARIVPHVNDTGLLASAIALAVWSGQYPVEQSWLTAKVLLLIAYIGTGTLALKCGKTKKVRMAALILALCFLGCLFKLALTRHLL